MSWRYKFSFASGDRVSNQVVEPAGLTMLDAAMVAKAAAASELQCGELTMIRMTGSYRRPPIRLFPQHTGVSHG